MTQEQIAYANFIKAICESYDCADAAKPLQEGFAALCESQAMFEGERWDKFKKTAGALGMAGAIAAGGALAAVDNHDRDEMSFRHSVNCGTMQDESKLAYMPDNNSDEAVELAYQLNDQLIQLGNENGIGRGLSVLDLEEKIQKDRRAVENATNQDELKAATKRLNLDNRQAQKAIYMVQHGGKCQDGKTIFATPKSGLLHTWNDNR